MEATCGSEAAKISKNKGKMVETSGSQPSQESEIPNQRGPGVVFILDNLLFQAEDDFRGTYPLLPNRIDNLCATYHVVGEFKLLLCWEFLLAILDGAYRVSTSNVFYPLQFILESPLNRAGMVQAVYVNFGLRGCFEIKPHADIVPSPNAFENLLRELFRTGRVLKRGTNEVTWQKICDIPSLVESLPANSRKIGCLSGTSPQDGINLQNYITAATNDQTFVFVVGEFTNKEIEAYIDDYVKVSEYELNAVACIADVCLKLERKCNMF